jgi:glycosyltransferase involved in cell wall biosynthesis
MDMEKDMISLVIPTYNEKENIEMLIPELFQVFWKSGLEAEVIVVDDASPDGTADAAERLSGKFRVRVVRRQGKLGLGSAVLDGFIASRGEILGVMDADMSHPPDKIPEMVRELKKHDMVFGSRKVPGGGIENWPLYRRIVSGVAGLLAKPLTPLTDPLSGFFFLNRSLIDDAGLNPLGFKIGLEIAVKCNPAIKEVPITFRNRVHGSSKMNRGEIWNYLLHLKSLYAHRARCRLGLNRVCVPNK